jgi:hypothetical protein
MEISSVSRFSALAAFSLLASCANVKPWERENLAKPLMDPSRDRLGLAMGDHMYFSREGSNGGGGVGGGGCGCN